MKPATDAQKRLITGLLKKRGIRFVSFMAERLYLEEQYGFEAPMTVADASRIIDDLHRQNREETLATVQQLGNRLGGLG